MKKFVAALLAVLLTVGVCAVSVVAEEPSEGTTYSTVDIVMPLANKNTDKDVTVLKEGDTVTFPTKSKKLEVTYYADVLSLPFDNIKNIKWKDYVTSLGTVTTFAASANKYKSFFGSTDFGSVAVNISYGIPAMNSEEYVFTARDSSGYSWGTFPIDYCLKNANGSDAKFLGWVVGAISNSSTKSTLALYAYFDRTATVDPTETTTDPVVTTDPDDENKSDIMKAFDKFFGLFSTDTNKYEDWKMYLTFIPGLPSLLFGFIAAFLAAPPTGTFWLKVYEFFGIVVE